MPGDVVPNRLVTGGQWLLSVPAEVPSIWGDGNQVLWSAGEALMIYGPTGVGKGTLSQQIVLGSIGVRGPDLLQFPLVRRRRWLYLALDRPSQIRRSLRRMICEADALLLDDGLLIYPGPLDFDVGQDPEAGLKLVDLCRSAGADTLAIDSLKDAAAELEKPAVSARVNRAIQHVLNEDIEVVICHHPRKAQVGNSKPKRLDDVFGGTWLTAGCGSVLLLWGEAGDALVSLEHLKQPAEVVGPLQLAHDHDTGTTTVMTRPDLLAVVRAHNGITAQAATEKLLDKDNPSDAEVKRYRMQLARLAKKGLVIERPGTKGGANGGTPSLYFAVKDITTDAQSDAQAHFPETDAQPMHAMHPGTPTDSKSDAHANTRDAQPTDAHAPPYLRGMRERASPSNDEYCWRCGAPMTAYDGNLRPLCDQHATPAASVDGAQRDSQPHGTRGETA